MIDKMEMLNRLGIVDWEDKLDFMMVTLISVVLKINDDGEGYDWSEISKSEFVELIGTQLLTMDYTEEMKKEVSDMFKLLSEYGEEGRSVIK